MEFDLIKKCVAYADSRSEGRKVSYNFTTNGTLLTEEKYEFLVEHDFALLVSLDGRGKYMIGTGYLLDQRLDLFRRCLTMLRC